MLKPLLLIPVVAVALAGCSAPQLDNASDGVLTVVASTNVYGDLAQSIAGDRAEVTSIIDDPSQDPHQFEANARVQLAMSRADVVIVNGGGYDDFATQMLAASGNDDAIVIDAVAASGADASVDGFNEHVWYDYATVRVVVQQLADALAQIDSEGATQFSDAAGDVDAGLQNLEQRVDELRPTTSGQGVVITEPVPLYLLDALGLENLTPPEFSEAIEDDSDIPPTLLQQVLNLLGDGSAALVVYNEQTGGPQTDAILDIASENQVPTIGVTETLPSDVDYVDWQAGYLDLIAAALTD